ncbi:MAG: hypothetical protein E7162_04640 [Firmicutes bacterium]|nr:hypothetical protein [Bacillota bacterium]
MFEKEGRVVRFDDDREYLIISCIDDDIDTYVYLMSVSGPLNILIAVEKEINNSITELIVIEDENEKKRLYNLFLQKARLGLL